jgi:excisionase family DNA binding protein
MAICCTDHRYPPKAGSLKPITVTVATTKKITGLSNTTIWKLIKERKLQTVSVGRRRLVTLSSVDELLAPKEDTVSQPRRRGRPRKARSEGAVP